MPQFGHKKQSSPTKSKNHDERANCPRKMGQKPAGILSLFCSFPCLHFFFIFFIFFIHFFFLVNRTCAWKFYSSCQTIHSKIASLSLVPHIFLYKKRFFPLSILSPPLPPNVILKIINFFRQSTNEPLPPIYMGVQPNQTSCYQSPTTPFRCSISRQNPPISAHGLKDSSNNQRACVEVGCWGEEGGGRGRGFV